MTVCPDREKKPTEVGKWGLDTAENTGRDGSPVGSVSVGSASPLADTENGDAESEVPEVNFNIYWSSSAHVSWTGSVATSVTITNQHLQSPKSTSQMVVGEANNAAIISVASGSGLRKASAHTLFSLSMEVPAYTRYSVPITAATYSRGREGNANSAIGSYIYSMGTDPEAVPRTYYTLSNNPSQYKLAGSHKLKWITNESVSDSKQQIYYFTNPTSETKTVTYYFYAGACSLVFNRYLCYGTVAYARLTMTEAPSMQRLVPTSYDVEYDQLRHSLEEEYYEAIRLDENYPTEQIPCASHQNPARNENKKYGRIAVFLLFDQFSGSRYFMAYTSAAFHLTPRSDLPRVFVASIEISSVEISVMPFSVTTASI